MKMLSVQKWYNPYQVESYYQSYYHCRKKDDFTEMSNLLEVNPAMVTTICRNTRYLELLSTESEAVLLGIFANKDL